MEGSGGKAYSGKRRKNKREGVVMKEYVVWMEEDKLAKHKEKDGCGGSNERRVNGYLLRVRFS